MALASAQAQGLCIHSVFLAQVMCAHNAAAACSACRIANCNNLSLNIEPVDTGRTAKRKHTGDGSFAGMQLSVKCAHAAACGFCLLCVTCPLQTLCSLLRAGCCLKYNGDEILPFVAAACSCGCAMLPSTRALLISSIVVRVFTCWCCLCMQAGAWMAWRLRWRLSLQTHSARSLEPRTRRKVSLPACSPPGSAPMPHASPKACQGAMLPDLLDSMGAFLSEYLPIPSVGRVGLGLEVACTKPQRGINQLCQGLCCLVLCCLQGLWALMLLVFCVPYLQAAESSDACTRRHAPGHQQARRQQRAEQRGVSPWQHAGHCEVRVLPALHIPLCGACGAVPTPSSLRTSFLENLHRLQMELGCLAQSHIECGVQYFRPTVVCRHFTVR